MINNNKRFLSIPKKSDSRLWFVTLACVFPKPSYERRMLKGLSSPEEAFFQIFFVWSKLLRWTLFSTKVIKEAVHIKVWSGTCCTEPMFSQTWRHKSLQPNLYSQPWKGWEIMAKITGDQSCWTYVTPPPTRRTRDSQMAFEWLYNDFIGANKASMAEDKLYMTIYDTAGE